MKYASVIIGLIILIVVLGIVFALVPRSGVGTVATVGNPVAYTSGAYPAYPAVYTVGAYPAGTGPVAYMTSNLQPVSYQQQVAYQQPVAYQYQASVINTVPVTAVSPIASNMPVAANMVAAGYPYPGNTYGTVPAVPVVPVVWYTAPSGPYRITVPASAYNYSYSSRSTTVIPGSTTVIPGSVQTYNYTTPGYSSGQLNNANYQYQSNYQYTYPSTGSADPNVGATGSGQWYR